MIGRAINPPSTTPIICPMPPCFFCLEGRTLTGFVLPEGVVTAPTPAARTSPTASSWMSPMSPVSLKKPSGASSPDSVVVGMPCESSLKASEPNENSSASSTAPNACESDALSWSVSVSSLPWARDASTTESTAVSVHSSIKPIASGGSMPDKPVPI